MNRLRVQRALNQKRDRERLRYEVIQKLKEKGVIEYLMHLWEPIRLVDDIVFVLLLVYDTRLIKQLYKYKQGIPLSNE